MAIEIEVAPQFCESEVKGVLVGDVTVRFDGCIETIHATVVFGDQGDLEANLRSAVSAAERLGRRLADSRLASSA